MLWIRKKYTSKYKAIIIPTVIFHSIIVASQALHLLFKNSVYSAISARHKKDISGHLLPQCYQCSIIRFLSEALVTYSTKPFCFPFLAGFSFSFLKPLCGCLAANPFSIIQTQRKPSQRFGLSYAIFSFTVQYFKGIS